MKKSDIKAFQKKVLDFYTKEGRHDLPWRKTTDLYKILVSEIMLQQTQVDRVVPKYKAFLNAFPNAKALASAPLSEVLVLWSGLGYNRRALYLKRAAETVTTKWKGKFPKTAPELQSLPGVGPYTARAVAAFAYNSPDVFIETNIRRVFLHEFFPKSTDVPDAKLYPLIEAALDIQNPRVWYWALMDYGSHLKATVINPNRRSKHYTKQSKFDGSLRQMRGAILKVCTDAGKISKTKLLAQYRDDRMRAKQALEGLVADGFVSIDTKNIVSV